eukprot:scaffold2682_cov155-Amphora_coffeaeformis.AAC.5
MTLVSICLSRCPDWRRRSYSKGVLLDVVPFRTYMVVAGEFHWPVPCEYHFRRVPTSGLPPDEFGRRLATEFSFANNNAMTAGDVELYDLS